MTRIDDLIEAFRSLVETYSCTVKQRQRFKTLVRDLRTQYRQTPEAFSKSVLRQIHASKAQVLDRESGEYLRLSQVQKEAQARFNEARETCKAAKQELAELLMEEPGRTLQVSKRLLTARKRVYVRSNDTDLAPAALARSGLTDCVQVSYARIRSKLVEHLETHRKERSSDFELEEAVEDFYRRYPELKGHLDVGEEVWLSDRKVPDQSRTGGLPTTRPSTATTERHPGQDERRTRPAP